MEHLLTGQSLGWYADTFKPLASIMREISDRVLAHVPNKESWFNKSANTFTIPGAGTAYFFSMENEDNARGWTFPLILVEEMGAWKEGTWESVVEPVAEKILGTSLCVGTPNPANPFDDFHHNLTNTGNDPEKKSWVIPAMGAVYDAELDKLLVGQHPLTRYANPMPPFDNPERLIRAFEKSQRKRRWMIEYLCSFVSDDGNQFDDVEKVCTIVPLQIGDEYFQRGYELESGRNGGWFQTGIDVGMKNDFVVITTIDRNTNRLVYLRRFLPGSNRDWDKVYDAAVRVYSMFPGKTVVDITGLGSHLETELPRRGVPITPINLSGNVKEPAMDRLASLIGTQSITLFDLDIIKTELKNVERKARAGGRHTIAATNGRHDDVPISLALCVYEINPINQGVISATSTTLNDLIAMNNTLPASPWNDPLW